MPISRSDPARRTLLAALLIANILVYLAWPWLRQMPLTSDSSQPFTLPNVVRNEAYLAGFFEAIREEQKILFIGTSESLPPYNLAAQLNILAPDGAQLVALSKGGTSPIHSALAIARAKRERMQFPPIIFVINPVYFTQSHDVIDDGWMSDMVRSPVFLQMNHREVREYLSEEVNQVYEEHFAFRQLLLPATVQEYLGNLLYLSFHQSPVKSEQAPLSIPDYKFDGSVPSYDKDKNVWSGKTSIDRFSKHRWKVNSAKDSFNLKGLASIVSILKREPAPVLLLFLPVNREFYEYHGLDMDEFDLRYQEIRRTLTELSQGNIYLLDLWDRPQLRFGFRDRMHMDQYGFFQLATYMVQSETYLAFIDAAKRYYGDSSPSHERTTTQKIFQQPTELHP